MRADYFVVGRTCVLRAQAEQTDADEFELAIWDGLRVHGQVRGQVSDESLVISVRDADALPAATRGEAYRLFARTCPQHFGRILPLEIESDESDHAIAEQLEADAFRRAATGRWRREPAAFIRTDKARDMDGVYDDPLCIPWNFVPREHDVLDLLLATAEEPRDRFAVLDLGCGFGKNATFLEERGFSVCGIDVSAVAIRRCRQLVRSPARYETASASTLPYASSTFNFVLDIGCLHCMSAIDRENAVHEIERVLVPGGALYSRIFNVRPQRWVQALPFHTAAFGMEPATAEALFSSRFEVSSPLSSPHVSYFVCRKR